MSDILIKNAFVLTMDDKRRFFEDGGIAIDGNRIVAVGKTAEVEKEFSADLTLNGKKMIAMPGLINGHDHYEQTFFKGLTRLFTGNTFEWLREFKMPLTKEMKAEDYYYSNLLACMEMIKMGVTCGVNSVCEQDPKKMREFGIESAVRAITESGVRSVIPISASDKFELPEFLVSTEEGISLVEEAIKKWHKKANDRIRIWAGPTGPFAVSEDMFLAFKELAKKYNVGVHTHIAFATRGEVKKAYESKLLGPDVTAAHCVWLDEEEINYFAKSGTKAVHCPTYKLSYTIDSPVEKFGDGIAPVASMMDAGITVGLGTDGCMADTHDLFKEMRCLVSVQHYKMLDKTILPPMKLLEMVTRNCAKTVQWNDEIGSIEVGKKADIILIDRKKPHMTPWTNPLACLVYLTSGSDVDTVIIDGKLVMENRKIKTIDEDKVMAKIQNTAEGLIERAGFKKMFRMGLEQQ